MKDKTSTSYETGAGMNGKAGAVISVLPAHEPSKMEIHAKKVLEDMREISAICNVTGHRWALHNLLTDLTLLVGDIERETDRRRSEKERRRK